ncbi:hypothetical protein KIPB_011697, partial [Kipferlia bialata]
CTLSDSDVQRIADAVMQSIKGYIYTMVMPDTYLEGERDTYLETVLEGERQAELVLDLIPEADSESDVSESEREGEREGEGDRATVLLVETPTERESDEVKGVERDDETENGHGAVTDGEAEDLVFFVDHPKQFDGIIMNTNSHTDPYHTGDTVVVFEGYTDGNGRTKDAVTYDIAVPPSDFLVWTMTPSSAIDASFGHWRIPESHQTQLPMADRLLERSADVVTCVRTGGSVTCSTDLGSFQYCDLNEDEYTFLPIEVSTHQDYARPTLTIAQSSEVTAATLAAKVADQATKEVYLERRLQEGTMRFQAGEGVNEDGSVFLAPLVDTSGWRNDSVFPPVVFAFPPCHQPTTWSVQCQKGTYIVVDDTHWTDDMDFTRDGDNVTVSQTDETTGQLVSTVLPTDDRRGNDGEELLFPLIIRGISYWSDTRSCVIQQK